MKRPLRRTGGYTLIEMALVIVILGILFGISTLRFDTLTRSSRLGASAREIGSTVGVAFSEALLTRKKQTLVFDTENGRYWIATEENPEGRSAAGIVDPRSLYRGVRFRDIQVGQDLFSEEGEVRIEISPLGVSTSCCIHLINEDEMEMTIQVHPLTGTVSYEDGYGADEEEDEGFDFAE